MAWPDAVLFDATTLLVAYFGLGILVYRGLEGWQPLDSVYFMIVTSTTVGYGDFAPVSTAGRLFTCLYALIGTCLLWKATAPILSVIFQLIDQARNCLPRRLLAGMHHAIYEGACSGTRVSEWIGYVRATLSPILFVVVGVYGYRSLLELNIADSVYVTMISMFTVGYGDIYPLSRNAKMAACVFLPFATGAIGEMIHQWLRTSSFKRIRETDHEKLIDEIMLQKAASE